MTLRVVQIAVPKFIATRISSRTQTCDVQAAKDDPDDQTRLKTGKIHILYLIDIDLSLSEAEPLTY